MRYELTKGREEAGEAPGSHMINMELFKSLCLALFSPHGFSWV